ncbi:ABC transporter substrate-binding protein [Roseiarcaceae bacterium H3SJ34-1]|uniref:substrate-binding periplasmic protein n=1 Tax=Terripilifer ovatus TaxID=3032367 RepID=UPI003AB92F9D|nr:ABC transporter substrate-binding protein [Roseiarcaceae bacterium H3SJ34-1]
MKPKNKSVSVAAFVVTVLASSAFAPAVADTLSDVKAKGVMTAGNSGSYPPFEYMADGKLTGFDVDLAEELGRRMGIKIQFTIIDFKGIVASLTSKRVDVLITALTKTPERAQQILFSEPYYDAGTGAAVLVSSNIKNPEDLEGKTIGLQIGSSGERYARTELTKYTFKTKTYDDFVLAVNDLKNKRVDAVLNSLPSLKYNTRNDPAITITQTWSPSDVGINTRKEDTALMDEINKHLVAMKNDGFLKSLDVKWFGR